MPHGDPVAVELIAAIHGGDLGTLRRLLAERPELASAHMIGRKGLEGGGMPAWTGQLSNDDIWGVIAFIRSKQGK